MTTAHKGRLTPEQVKAYHEDGYVLFKEPVFPQAKFDRLRETLRGEPGQTRRRAALQPARDRPQVSEFSYPTRCWTWSSR